MVFNINKYMKEYYSNHKEYWKEYGKEYRQRPKVKLRIKEYNKTAKYKETKKRCEERYYIKTGINLSNGFIIHKRLKSLLSMTFKRYSATGKVKNSNKYGIDYKAIIKHLQPFPEPICEYQVDHIIALCRFDFNNPEHIKKAFMPSNHQWLTKAENLSKGNKLIMPHIYGGN